MAAAVDWAFSFIGLICGLFDFLSLISVKGSKLRQGFGHLLWARQELRAFRRPVFRRRGGNMFVLVRVHFEERDEVLAQLVVIGMLQHGLALALAGKFHFENIAHLRLRAV